jgi:regulator of protease activity HflC (stomatin/prohibitin superfamily)
MVCSVPTGIVLGIFLWFTVRYVITTLDHPISEALNKKDLERYIYPQVRVIPPGGPYYRWPWEKVHKVSVATETMNLALDLETPSANSNGTELDAVTKDQLNIGLTGQIRYRPAEQNLYAYLFGVKTPIIHVMGYFIAILRQRIASFEAQVSVDEIDEMDAGLFAGVSINDLRKNLDEINVFMEGECGSAPARYGVEFDASLITGIDPPPQVESALAAINTAHNEVHADISLAKAEADQTIVQSRRAVEIETLKAQAEVEPLLSVAEQLQILQESGPNVLSAYLRNIRLGLYKKAQHAIVEVENG